MSETPETSEKYAEEVADGRKLEISIQMDTRSGRFFGRHDAVEDNELSRDIAANVFKSIGSIGQNEARLAEELQAKCDAYDHEEAARLALSDEAHVALMFAEGRNLFHAALNVDHTRVSEEHREEFLKFIVGLASKVGIFAPVYQQTKELLASLEDHDNDFKHSLTNMLGLAEAERGAPEAALRIWQNLLSEHDGIRPGERGWIYRNMGFVYLQIDHPRSQKRAVECFQQAIDAFLEAGDKNGAIDTSEKLAKLLAKSSAGEAFDQFDRMLELCSNHGALDEEITATVHYAKAKRLLDAGRHHECQSSALEAARIRRGLHGAEEGLISSLHLAAIAANFCGDDETKEKCVDEAAELERMTGSRHFAFGRRITSLMESFDRSEADALIGEARESGDTELIAASETAAVLGDSKLSNVDKLARFEALHTELEKLRTKTETLKPIRMGVAVCFKELDDFENAARWFRKILDDNPLDVQAATSLVDALWKADQWGDAATELAEQIARFGEQPGYVFAYGRSLFEAGDLSGAVQALTKSMKLASTESDIHQTATELRERALQLGGVMPSKPIDLSPPSHVTLEQVDAALREFGNFVSSAKRMEFWRRKKKEKGHNWVQNPERFGQTLLHTFLKARFLHSVQIFEELNVGAGRLDVLAQFAGGLRVIIELKICGGGYSTTYAQSGDQQIQHYMENEGVHIGFLMTFDGRIRKKGELLVANTGSHHTIREVLIDMRSTVKS
ncbi:hypothetical protein SAMN04488030_2603 [Aliiroseovarius halocynthiae]|uniref:Uncharacterized protein n=1 Tax=Aliiroseovarius halocynthiae TaxID=985055 RepID=A0A545SPW4_9RHOB|nr:hypothetical protein [Aliiroseovarius halocynthiae]TQV67025.1 hypothetical protein FIL88_10570 [Aliiroseovarius halocynthiae]SMR82256.1 hypothetical protein SAMN04488030_2603 [Aliiroseovarius halocynthiae]